MWGSLISLIKCLGCPHFQRQTVHAWAHVYVIHGIFLKHWHFWFSQNPFMRTCFNHTGRNHCGRKPESRGGKEIIKHTSEHTSHLDLLDNLDELHLCWHVAHGPHAVCNVFVMDEAICIVVKFLKGLPQLWWTDKQITKIASNRKVWENISTPSQTQV